MQRQKKVKCPFKILVDLCYQSGSVANHNVEHSRFVTLFVTKFVINSLRFAEREYGFLNQNTNKHTHTHIHIIHLLWNETSEQSATLIPTKCRFALIWTRSTIIESHTRRKELRHSTAQKGTQCRAARAKVRKKTETTFNSDDGAIGRVKAHASHNQVVPLHQRALTIWLSG